MFKTDHLDEKCRITQERDDYFCDAITREPFPLIFYAWFINYLGKEWDEAYPNSLPELIAKYDELRKLFQRQLAKPECPTVTALHELRFGKRCVVQENWERAFCFEYQAVH